jgi:hypothetical protein
MGGESAYDAEAKALVYQTVEFGEFESASGDALTRRSCAFRGLAARAGIGHDENGVADPVLFRQVLCIEKYTEEWSTQLRIFELCVCRSADPQLRVGLIPAWVIIPATDEP